MAGCFLKFSFARRGDGIPNGVFSECEAPSLSFTLTASHATHTGNNFQSKRKEGDKRVTCAAERPKKSLMRCGKSVWQQVGAASRCGKSVWQVGAASRCCKSVLHCTVLHRARCSPETQAETRVPVASRLFFSLPKQTANCKANNTQFGRCRRRLHEPLLLLSTRTVGFASKKWDWSAVQCVGRGTSSKLAQPEGGSATS